ncbi:hypothetical protein KM295_07560 [Natronomonas sp. F2-12]|uniref:Uncharacterized protein n=1 Tax=Natronomonas aquatica TaxID=2841590 RepID=A0A9R1CTF5_9EURY|nr:hypothetical protein [Natronomonas aquatica]MCQ4333336.1 hypothetical protein [Natronomonas aquatica]
MAEMNGRDRGQLLLVAGVLLAVLFVALALLINAAIYTDNVATRGDDPAGEALTYQAGVTDAVGDLIDAENAAADEGDGFGTVNGSVTSGVSEIDAAVARNNLGRAAATETTVSRATEGRLIRERNVDGFESWETNASAVRGFVIDLDTDNMTADSSFVIDLDGTELEVNKTGGNVVVEGGVDDATCETNADGTVRFDVTGERIDGDVCRFGWPTLDGDSNVTFENGTHAGGSYELTVASGEDPTGPQTTPAVYSVDLALRMDTPELRYETTVTVAPGEHDG